MTHSGVILGAALFAAAAAWRSEAAPRPAPPPPAAPAVRCKPKVKIPVVTKRAFTTDNSNSSYAALGLRARLLAEGAPDCLERTAWRFKHTHDGMLTLKERVVNAILALFTRGGGRGRTADR